MRWLAPLLLLLAACPSAAPAEVTTPSGKKWTPNRILHFDYLVWTGGETPETVWIDRTGRELGRAPGILVALRGSVWKLEIGPSTTTSYGCTTESKQIPVTRVSLTGPGDDEYELAYNTPSYGLLEGSHQVTLLGEVGRYWFLREDVQSTACDGTKANYSVGVVFDMVSSDWKEELTMDDDENAYALETVPVWKDGALTLRQRAPAGKTLREVRLPGSLADEAELPEPVRARLSQGGDGPVGVSYGLPDARWKRTFGAK
jgi:hypothetical protein